MAVIRRISRLSNPRRAHARRARRNPAWLMTFGNPAKRKTSRAASRKRNAVRKIKTKGVTFMAHRRRNTAPRKKHYRRRNPRRAITVRRRRNPVQVFNLSGTRLLAAIGGGLVGVAAAKALPRMVPGGFLGGGIVSNVLLSVGAAFAAGWAARKFTPAIGDAVLFGGLMQAGSVALNQFFPPPLSSLALSGMGELVPGSFPVPQNPVSTGSLAAAPAPAPRMAMQGLQRAFGYAI